MSDGRQTLLSLLGLLFREKAGEDGGGVGPLINPPAGGGFGMGF